MHRAKIRFVFGFFVVCLITVAGLAAESGIQPNAVGPTDPFGSIVVSLLPASPDPNVYPLWTPAPCQQVTGASSEVYADNPEQWTVTDWNNKNKAEFEDGLFSGAGNVDVYFQNELGATARVYIGARSAGSTTATLSYAGAAYDAGPGSFSGYLTYPVAGAHVSQVFIQALMSGSGYASATVPSSSSKPLALLKASVANGNVIEGELSITNTSAPVNVYVYADDCAGTPCPGLGNIAIGDSQKRGGLFLSAAFSIVHGSTMQISNSSGGISWLDIGRTGASNDTCIVAISGSDPVRGGASRMLKGDYGVPIEITGTPQPGLAQFWYMTPRGNKGFATALWLGGYENPANYSPEPAQAYYLPTTAPGASPQPTAVPDTHHDIVLGLESSLTPRTIVYVPSGGDSWPVRFSYLIPCYSCMKPQVHRPTLPRGGEGNRQR